MPRRIADYASTAGWNDLNLLATIGGFTDRGEHAAVPVERLRLAAQRPGRRRRPVGGATPSSGRPARRRRRTTSTTCRRSAPSGRCSTCATAAHGRGTDRARAARPMTRRQPRTPSRPAEHSPRRRRCAHDQRGGHQQPGPRDAPVHHLRGDVLRAACSPPTSTSGPNAPPWPPDGVRATPSRSCRSSGRRRPPDPRARSPASSRSGRSGATTGPAFLRNMPSRSSSGIIFLLMQAYDYALLGSARADPRRPGTFGTTYYTLTGFHGAHVFGGVIMLAVVLYRGHGRPVLGAPPRRGRGGVAVLALRRRRLDPAVLAPLPAARQIGVADAPASAPAQRRPRRDRCSWSSGSSTGPSRTSGGWHVDYAGRDDAHLPRRRDGAHGLRAGRRLVEGVTPIARARAA